MSTSLAEQLQRLAVPQTTLLTRDKKRTSLLFDPREAANFSKEIFYQIGLDGLEELKDRNPSFSQFEATLFNIVSKDFERSVQTEEANKKLDNCIRKFLLLLSPYYLLNCAHKALEWLVYRYQIHDYNRDDLVMLILPYHETNIFVRTLQLIRIRNENDKLFWLKSLQKPGVHLPKTSLLNHASSDPHFLKAISKYVLAMLKEHEKPSNLTTIFNFYCVTIAGAIERTQSVNDTQVSMILPSLLKALQSDIPDFCAAGYVIAARLVAKTQLSEKILEVILNKVANVRLPSLKTEATLLLIVIHQSQNELIIMSREAVECLSQSEWFTGTLRELSDGGSYIQAFLTSLVKSVLEYGLMEDGRVFRDFLERIVDDVKFDEEAIVMVINTILDISNKKKQLNEESENWLPSLLQTIEKQYPDAFDKHVNKILKSSSEKEHHKKRKRLRKLLQKSMHLQDSFGIFEKLYHPQPNIRQEAIRHLTTHYEKLKDRQKERIRRYFLDRLADDNPDVVAETLGLSKNMLLDILEKDKLNEILIRLGKKCLENKEAWWMISKSVIEVLCSNYTNDVKVFLTVLQFLLPTTKDELSIAIAVVDSTYGKQCEFLKPIHSKLRSATSNKFFLNAVSQNLPNIKLMMSVETFIGALKEIPLEDYNALQKYLVLLILTNFLPENCSVTTATLVIDIFLLYLDDCNEENYTKKPLKQKGIVNVRTTNKLPLHGFAKCVQIVTARIEKLNANLGILDLHSASDNGQFCFTLMKFLLRLLQLDETLLETFDACVRMLCPNLQQLTEFLLNFSITPRQEVDSTLRMQCLEYLVSVLRKKQDQLKEFASFGSVIVPYIIIIAGNEDPNIRGMSTSLMTLVLRASGKSKDNYGFLLAYIVKHKEEFLMDHEQVPTLIANALSEQDEVRKDTLKAMVLLTHSTTYSLYFNAEMLHLLQHINDIKILSKTSTLALQLLENEATHWDSIKSQILYRNIARFDSSVAADLELNTNVWKFVELCLKNEQLSIEYATEKTAPPAVLMMNQITRETFDYLRPHVKSVLLDAVITIATTTQNPDVLATANRIFKHIDLDVSLVFEQLHKMRDVKSPKQVTTKRRVSVLPTVDILEMLEWKKGVTVLEFIQTKKKMQNAGALLPVLFEILKKCLDFDEQASVEYPKQLVLSSILHCRNKTEDENVPENAFNVELIVQCIRASQNPQTHHHALILLASVASLVPTQVLHHIMAIFTFMGSSVLRHDDAYSFQIITKIIDTVVPVLIQTGNEQQITEVLRVFVDVLLDVPEHRRLPLYKQLLERIDARENLHLFFLLVFEAHVLHSSSEKQKNPPNIGVDLAPKRLDIAADLSRLFSQEIQLYSCLKVLQYLQTLPVEKGDHMEVDSDSFLFNISAHTSKQFRHYKYTIVLFISNLLTSKIFVNQVAELSDDELLGLEGLYKDLIVNTLKYIQNTAKVVDRNVNTQQAQFWKAMLHYSYEILDSVNALLTPQMFLLVMKGLMVHSFPTVRKRALELLNAKLQNAPAFFEEKDLSTLIPPLIDIVKTIAGEEVEPENEVIVQTALLSLKLLIRRLAGDDPQRYVPILNFIIDLVRPGKINDNILASLILCLADLVVNLRAHAIPGLNKYMPVVIKVLKAEKQIEQKPSLLLLCAATALQKIIDTLPLFLSPYLEKILCEISMLSGRFEAEDQYQATVPLVNKLKTIKEQIGTSIPQRVLIPAIESSYNTLIEKRKYSCVCALMDILAQSLSNLKGNDIQQSLPELTAFFLHALQLRANVELSCEQIETVESEIVKALTVLTLKLSENSFRPLYYRLFDWAIRGSEKSEKVITFYCLSHGFAECLKGLFILFAGHFINNAASVLDACNAIKSDSLYFEEEDKNVVLLENVLKTLSSVFLYDTQTFVNKDRFDVLMQPVVDQLENTLGGVEKLITRARNILIPCIVNFAVATANDALWKQMNYQILLKMRHTSPKIRLIALECLTGVAKRLEEDFLPLLPETIPFLAELLEDEDENVEKACERAVQELEKVLGEPLKKYF